MAGSHFFDNKTMQNFYLKNSKNQVSVTQRSRFIRNITDNFEEVTSISHQS